MVWRLRLTVSVLLCVLALPVRAEGAWAPHVTQFVETDRVTTLPPALTGWDARIEYDVTANTADAPSQFSTGDPTRTVFATVQRRFAGPDLSPYVGIVAGYAESLVDTPSSILSDALAFKGVFGTDFSLDDNVGAFLEYNFAVAPGALSEGGRTKTLRSHSISTGLRLDLN